MAPRQRGKEASDRMRMWRQQRTGDDCCWRGSSDRCGYGLPPKVQNVQAMWAMWLRVLTKFRAIISPTAGVFALGFLRLCTKNHFCADFLCRSAQKLLAVSLVQVAVGRVAMVPVRLVADCRSSSSRRRVGPRDGNSSGLCGTSKRFGGGNFGRQVSSNRLESQ